MMATLRRIALLGLTLTLLASTACATTSKKKVDPVDPYLRPSKTPTSYEESGRWWGAKHAAMLLSPGSTDDQLIQALKNEQMLDFFDVHSELKDAFKKGYRIGFEGRTADLVLGPHLTEAAALIGRETSTNFVTVINVFERDWALALRKAVDVFVVLIAEGSQADRERFISSFTAIYGDKYKTTQALLKEPRAQLHISEGGTALYLDVRKTIAVMTIPQPDELKTEIYRQTFRAMGDEWGRRLSNNLMRRDDLIDVLRRSKTAFQEVKPSLEDNLCLVRSEFIDSYGTDADNVFVGMAKEAGYTAGPCRKPTPAPTPTPPPSPRPRPRGGN